MHLHSPRSTVNTVELETGRRRDPATDPSRRVRRLFWVIGIVGALLLVISLIFDDVLDGLLPETEIVSLPVIAAAMVAFGFGTAVLDGQAGFPLGLAVAGGAVLAALAGAGAVRAGQAAMGMATDATPTAKDFVGTSGRVITPIPRGSVGEIVVRMGGQPVKLTAVLLDERSTTGAPAPSRSTRSPRGPRSSSSRCSARPR